MSRQMAFQFTNLQLSEGLEKLDSLPRSENPQEPYGKKLERHFPDEKERERMLAVVQIAALCQAKGLSLDDVKKVICWRNEEGKPHQMEIQLNRRLR